MSGDELAYYLWHLDARTETPHIDDPSAPIVPRDLDRLLLQEAGLNQPGDARAVVVDAVAAVLSRHEDTKPRPASARTPGAGRALAAQASRGAGAATVIRTVHQRRREREATNVAAVSGVDGRPATSALQHAARRHLWRHFAPIGGEEDVPIFVRGEGCELWDEDGNRYLDALSSLFCVNVGHGREELADAAAKQARELAYATTWDTAHPRAIELAQKIATLAPGDLNRVFFTSGGSESVESALKLARSYHHARGEPSRTKVIARELAYHGTTFGALSATGLPSVRAPFEPLMPGGCHVPHTDVYRTDARSDPLHAADAIEERIAFEDPATVAAVILEPVQNSGGCLPPPPGYFVRVREICDRHGVLLISDDTICSWGRLGTWFGGQRFDYAPDIVTTAKGLTSGYAPMGAVIVSDRVAEPFLDGGAAFAHGLTFGGHPVAAAVALANIGVIEDENLLAHVQRHEAELRETLEDLGDVPIVGDVRGAGYFWGIELVADQATKRPFPPDDANALIDRVLAPGLRERGLIARAADRGFPVIQLAPPLIAGPDEFAEIGATLREVLAAAQTWVAQR